MDILECEVFREDCLERVALDAAELTGHEERQGATLHMQSKRVYLGKTVGDPVPIVFVPGVLNRGEDACSPGDHPGTICVAKSEKTTEVERAFYNMMPAGVIDHAVPGIELGGVELACEDVASVQAAFDDELATTEEWVCGVRLAGGAKIESLGGVEKLEVGAGVAIFIGAEGIADNQAAKADPS